MKRVLKQIFTIACSVFVVAYTIMQLSLSAGSAVETEHAFFSVVNDTLKVKAYIFRDETVVMQSGGGTRSYTAENGEKVHIGTELCVTYQDSNEAGVQENINKLDHRIDLLTRSNILTSSYSTDLAKINNNISSHLLQIQRNVAIGDLAAAQRMQEDLLVQMNRRQATVADSKDYFGNRISALERQKAELEAGLSGVKVTTTASAAGYFYSAADGYESVFSASALNTISVEGFRQLMEKKPSEEVLKNAVGKIAHSSKWYIAFIGNRRDAAYFEEGGKYSFVFPYSDDCEIDMQFEHAVGDTKSEEVVLVFSSNILRNNFSFTRMQDVLVIKNTMEGLKIRTTALRNEDGETGVYVLSSGRVVFKAANVLCENGGFYLVELPNPKDRSERSGTKLSLHDTVLIGGKNLYVGKVLQ